MPRMPSEAFEKKKSLGQHFLRTDIVPTWMCDAAQVTAGDVIVEIGPGTGILTEVLLARGATVIAIEADPRAVAILKDRFHEYLNMKRLTVHHGDVRQMDLGALGLIDHGYKVVANIPYYLTGLLLRQFLAGHVQPSTLVFLMQKEVAKRITASRVRGEKESLASLSVKVFGNPTYVRTVGKGHFDPPPKIDSGILLVEHISRNAFQTIDQGAFFALLHAAFGNKRKQLLGNLSAIYGRTNVTHILSTLGIRDDVRAEDIPLEQWLQIAAHLLSTGDAQ